MLINWNLGIILDSDGKPINHRSLLKVLVNPFLRTTGWQITTPISDNNVIGTLVICRCPAILLQFSFDYCLKGKETLLKKRRVI
jgi:hypothetical protein